MKFSFLILWILVVSCLASPTWALAEIKFIVNDKTAVSRLTASELRDYYYKRKRQWPDGTAVRFIDRGAGSDIRKSFLANYLKISSEDLDLYWIGQKLYTGDNAPLQQTSESLTFQLVSSLKGSISYVSSTATLPAKGIKVLTVDNAEF